MLIALISDIHSNVIALEAVLKKIKELGAERTYFLGDAVGYGPWPRESVELLMENCYAGVLGNHDAGVVKKIDISNYYDAIRYVLEWTRTQLGEKEMAYLSNLRYIYAEQGAGSFLCAHGSPRQPEKYDYILSRQTLDRLYEVEPFLKKINFVAHSHFMNFFVMAGKGNSVELDISSGKIELDFTYPAVCVIGSVGQPRDGDKRSSFVTFDTEKNVVGFHRVEYDVLPVANRIRELKLPRSFADRLLEGC